MDALLNVASPASTLYRRDSTPRTAREDEFPIRELPACVLNRRPGVDLTNAECIEAIQWVVDVLHDAANAARATPAGAGVL